jgi:hypothetical protein
MSFKLDKPQLIIFIISILIPIFAYFFIDLFYTDLPPYSIKLTKTTTYIYLQDKINLEVYSFLDYKSNFLIKTPLRGKKISLYFPFSKSNILKINNYQYSGFEEFLLDDGYFMGTMDYNKKNNQEEIYCKIYFKATLNGNKYIHYFDLPAFWSFNSIVEHYVILNSKENLIVMNLLPFSVYQKDSRYYIKVENKDKKSLSLVIF